jgi:prepilin-type N-terminal cleavage/methylation domain-containing protein
MMQSSRQGMSLLEISIAIVVIGLLAGGILIGRDLAQRYEVRKILLEANSYVVSLQQFKAKYGALPGDMPNATSVWGRADGGGTGDCLSPLTDISSGAPTCNGNGNGIIDTDTSFVNPATGFVEATCEYYRVWQQLVAGEFITGSFTGVSGIAGCAANSQPGVNVPKGAMDATGYSIASFGEVTTPPGNARFFDGNYANTLMFGGKISGNYSINPALTAADALQIDMKADDGAPTIGNIRVTKTGWGPTPNCLTAGNVYNLTNPAPACAILFLNGYLRNPGAQ